MFPTDLKMAVSVMGTIITQGGIAPGGINFDCKVRRESTNVEDLFIAHINGMDTFARALRICEQMNKEGDLLLKMKNKRYQGYEQGIGLKIIQGTTFDELEKHALQANPTETVIFFIFFILLFSF